MTIRVVIADNHKILRDELRELIAGLPEVTVVGEARNGREAVALVAELAPDLVIMDVAMPELSGIEATRAITGEGTGTRVLGLSMHASGPYVREMLGAGAAGYVLKDCAAEELADAIRAVLADQSYISRRVALAATSPATRPAGA